MKNRNRTPKGFTLVELTVSMAIAGVLMLGLSVFFSSAFHNMFQAQIQEVNTQRQFAVNEIVRSKFNNIIKIVEVSQPDDDTGHLIAYTKAGKKQLPVTYIGIREINGQKRLVFKDLFVFNDVLGRSYIDSGGSDDQLISLSPDFTSESIQISGIKRPTGFTSRGNYYIASPDENLIYECPTSTENCQTTLNIRYENDTPYKLNHPTDIETDGEFIYISDSGNGKILQVSVADQAKGRIIKELPENETLNFPTGLAYQGLLDEHDPMDKGSLFIAETLNNRILKIDLNDNSLHHVMGSGQNNKCNGSIALCKLNLPTGLFARKSVNYELYVADSGNNRILRVWDPGIPTTMGINIEAGGYYALESIKIENENWNGVYEADSSTLIGDNNDWNSENKEFKNPDKLNIYHAGGTICESKDGAFYSQANPSDYGLDDGDVLRLRYNLEISEPITITEIQEVDCLEGDEIQYAFEVSISGDATGFNGGEAQIANPLNIGMHFNNVNFGEENGYQTLNIIIRDKNVGQVQEEYISVAIGDLKIGTQEDQVEVLLNEDHGLFYPTAIGIISGKQLVSNPLIEELKIFDDDDPEIPQITHTIKALSVDDLTNFDYISDFPVDSLTFSLYNNGKILEMLLEAGGINYPIKTDLP